MRKKRVRVAVFGGCPVLVRDKRKPPPNGIWASTPNEVLYEEKGLEDQTDNPHSAGLTVVRQDRKGWYIRTSQCEDPYGHEDGYSGTRCNRQKPHVKGTRVEEALAPESEDKETVFWCTWCWEEDGLEQ